MPSIKKSLTIAAIALIAVAIFHFSSRPESVAGRTSQSTPTAAAGSENNPVAAGSARSAARSELALQAVGDLKRKGAQAAAIEFSVVAMESRKPLPGALVSVFDERGARPLDEALTNGQGKGRFEASEGRYRLEAVQDGYQKGKDVFTHDPAKGVSHQTVFLSAAHYLHGNVADQRGQAIAGAQVTLKTRGKPEIVLKSDSKGYFEIALPPATYRVEVRKDPYLSKVKPFILVGPRNAPVLDIILKDGPEGI